MKTLVYADVVSKEELDRVIDAVNNNADILGALRTLFIGACFASAAAFYSGLKMHYINESKIVKLERQIDELKNEIDDLKDIVKEG